MIPVTGHAPHWLMLIGLILLAVGLVASLWRLLVGPTLPDRVVALDLLGFLVIGLVCMAGIVTHEVAFLGVSLVAALILFLGTAAFAMYLERRGAP